ncbi:MAG: LiaF transmembrane domain-containing protein [Bellilinea sp.]
MERRNRPSIFWALLLIVLGAVLLLNTMQILPGNLFELILKLWPLLFIIGGLDNMIQGHGWVWGVISLGLGTIFLLANFGYLEWSSLSLLLKLWPLLLVALGLDLIFQGRSMATTIIGILLAILIVVSVAWFAISSSPTARLGNTPLMQSLEGATSANIRISDPVGRLEISSGANDDLLMEGTVDLPGNQTLSQDYEVKNKHGSLNLSTSGKSVGPWMTGFDEPLWLIEVTDDVPLTLNTETAAGSMSVDLTGLDVTEFTATVAVGSLDVTLDSEDEMQGKLSNPVGKITIHIPDGALVEITFETAISAQNVPDGFTKIGKTVYSPNATAENARISLIVEQPIGFVSLTGVK